MRTDTRTPPIATRVELARRAVAAAEAAETAAELGSRSASAERDAGRASRGEEQTAKRRHLAAIDVTEEARKRFRAVETEQRVAAMAAAAAAADQRAEVKQKAMELEAQIGTILADFDDRLTWIETAAARINNEAPPGGLTVAITPPSGYRQAFQFLTTGLANLRANFPVAKEASRE